MKWNDVFCNTFKAMTAQLGLPPEDKSLPEISRADDSDFCQEILSQGWLSEAQLHRAARRYQLGKSRSGKCIFWMINEIGQTVDGHIGSGWVSTMLKQRYPECSRYIRPEHCLFGLHQVSEDEQRPVAIVESERSAVILSELLPKQLWMATAYPSNFNLLSLAPLQGRRVILYPRTDPAMEHYLAWLEIADQARRKYQLDITVRNFLEEQATPEQKEREIDLWDYIRESV